MSQVAISGNASGTGTLTIAAPNTNSNYTLNLPAATGTVMVSGNMPAFSAYQSVSQTISGGAYTKITFTTEEFDTNSNFASSTFTPTVAGYYQIDAAVSYQNATAGELIKAQIYKNGTSFKVGSLAASTVTQGACSSVSALIYMNGSTDYIEVYIYASGLGGTTPTNAAVNTTYFQGVMVRGA